MKNRTSIGGALMIGLLISWTAHAGGAEEPAVIPEAQAIIDYCRSISHEKTSSENTDRQREGLLDTALCLEDAIIKHADILIDDLSLTKDQIKEKMRALRFSYGGLYWSIYNDVEACDPGCGTFFHIIHNMYLTKLYESILKDIIKQRKKYEQ